MAADPESCSLHSGDRAVHYACMYGRVAVLKTLCARGALLDVCNARGAGPLHMCARYGEVGCAEVLLLTGRCPLDAPRAARAWGVKDRPDNTPLYEVRPLPVSPAKGGCPARPLGFGARSWCQALAQWQWGAGGGGGRRQRKLCT